MACVLLVCLGFVVTAICAAGEEAEGKQQGMVVINKMYMAESRNLVSSGV